MNVCVREEEWDVLRDVIDSKYRKPDALLLCAALLEVCEVP